MPHQPDEMLTHQHATASLRQICSTLGLTWSGADLLGPIGDSAVFRLRGLDVVARLAPAAHRARLEHEQSVSRWLAERGVPVVRIAPGLASVSHHGDVVASFWQEIREPVPGSPGEIGDVLQQLHAIRPPTSGLLPTHDPFVRQREYIATADIPSSDKNFLLQRMSDLGMAYLDLAFRDAPVVVHGDAHRKNVLRGKSGTVHILDLERFGVGPWQWDAVVPAVYHRVGWYTDSDYAAFVDAYGRDITSWSGCETLMGIRQLRMTTWLAARTGREPGLIDEVLKRIASLRDESVGEPWKPGE